jgi:hypothetical protein
MTKFTTGLTLLALTAALAVATPAVAAPSMGMQFGNGGHERVNCRLPQNANDPACMMPAGQPQQQPQGGGGGQGNWNHDGNGGNGGQANAGGQPGMGGPNDHRQGGFTFSSRDRNQFHQSFGFSFGGFATPGFSINVGVAVPHSYNDLRPVPRKVYRAYPQFRGYLYFVSRRGDFVIVSPRSHRVVAVI